jgi:hypothetical protein
MGLVSCLVLLIQLASPFAPGVHGAVKVRVYPLGESDEGAEVGLSALSTTDIQPSPTQDSTGGAIMDSGGSFVPLVAADPLTAPKYILGRTSGLALDFDGVDDYLQAPPFDPRDMAFNRQQFNALSQAWVRPHLDGKGQRQLVWQLGNENGSVAITPEGFWELVPGGAAAAAVTTVPVAFNEWTHVAVLRTGNDGRIYINGSLIVVSGGFWNGPGAQVLGASVSGSDNFWGSIDDFNISGFPDLSFNPANDLDVFQGVLSGVPGDIVQDSVLDIKDYEEWSKNVGFDNRLGAGDPFTQLKGDIDRNGRVNFFDLDMLIRLAAEAGTPLPAQLIPEPTGVALMCGGLLAALTLRRRRFGR